jgi:hypothetical protein
MEFPRSISCGISVFTTYFRPQLLITVSAETAQWWFEQVANDRLFGLAG